VSGIESAILYLGYLLFSLMRRNSVLELLRVIRFVVAISNQKVSYISRKSGSAYFSVQLMTNCAVGT